MLTISLLFIFLVSTEVSAMPEGEELSAVIADYDARLFWAAFEGCDVEALSSLLGDDFRMVHDLSGLAVPSRDAFIEGMSTMCASRLAGGDNEGYKNRRLATPGSRRVQALGNWGALEEGHHSFYELQSDGSWKLTGGARYIHVWQWLDDRFVLSESISVDHDAALPYPPSGESKD